MHTLWIEVHGLSGCSLAVQSDLGAVNYLVVEDSMMPDPVVREMSVHLTDSLFRSSRDALKRSESVSPKGDESLGVYTSSMFEIQAVVECAIASFLTIEALVNRFFSNLVKRGKTSPFERWLKSRWHFGLRTEDKITLVLDHYASTDFLDFPILRELFLEMTSFRNTLVHTTPQDYEMLIQPSPTDPTSGTLASVAERSGQSNKYPKTKLSSGIWSLRHEDAAKCHEIMVLMLAFLGARFKDQQSLVWKETGSPEKWRVTTPEDYLKELPVRYFVNVDVTKFGVSVP